MAADDERRMQQNTWDNKSEARMTVLETQVIMPVKEEMASSMMTTMVGMQE